MIKTTNPKIKGARKIKPQRLSCLCKGLFGGLGPRLIVFNTLSPIAMVQSSSVKVDWRPVLPGLQFSFK
jgi:hypothetical protein